MDRRGLPAVIVPPLLLLLAAAVVLDGPAAAHAGPPYRVDHRLEAEPDRRDATVWHSPPDSLRLNANVGENAYHRFPDRPVKGGVKYRLAFHYLIAAGSVGECQVKVSQYDDSGRSWRMLGRDAIERPLTVVGRWQEVVLDFQTQPDATSLAVTFSVHSPCDVYETWVDSVVLKPVGTPITVGP